MGGQVSEILNAAEASKALGVSVGTLYRYEREGKLKPDFKTLGGHYRYRVSTIEALKAGETDGI